VVLPSGDVCWADRDTPIPADWPQLDWEEPEVKTAAGFYPADNLLDLMIGQEGTLGIITRARLKLIPAPAAVLGLVCFFPDLTSCIAFVECARSGAARRGALASPGALDPRAIEYFDAAALDMARERVPDIPVTAQAALFIEMEHDGEPPLEAWWDALMNNGALAEDTIVADDESGRARLHMVRHAIPAGVNEQVVANGMPKVGTDFSVPDEALVEMMEAYAEVSLPTVCFGHIGDNHLHLNFLPRSESELAEARSLYRTLAVRAVSLGGTVSAEHGIGKIKRALLADMVGPKTIAQFRSLKLHIDPMWVLGRGTMLAKSSTD
jgi:D-lactate dehydrogenase (cytochrome)